MLFLRNQVFLCQDGRYYVFMDVNRDRYACITKNEFDRLLPWLGEPFDDRSSTTAPTPAMPDRERALANEFIEAGLLSSELQDSKPLFSRDKCIAAKSDLTTANRSIRLDALSHASAIVPFSCGALRANLSLRRQSLQQTVRAVADRKRRLEGNTNPLDLERVTRLIAAFRALRLYFPRSYLCLFDSLALLEFLAMYKIMPDWVFGVQSEPFAAHCWLQHEDVVLNDSLESISLYTPIMTV